MNNDLVKDFVYNILAYFYYLEKRKPTNSKRENESRIAVTNGLPNSIIVWEGGLWKVVPSQSAWEYENDPDWLVTIELKSALEDRGHKTPITTTGTPCPSCGGCDYYCADCI